MRMLSFETRLLLLAMGAFQLSAQGCYVKYGDKTILGSEDVSLPGAKLQSGCVVDVKRGTSVYPPEPSNVRFVDPQGATFQRYVPFGTTVEVGKCYEWKMKLGNPMTPWWPEVNEQTLREVGR